MLASPLIARPHRSSNNRAPHVILHAGAIVTNLTSHVDLVPTLIELAGGTALPGMRGTSLVPFLRGMTPASPRPDHVAMEYHSNFANTGSFSLRQGNYKLFTFGHTFPW